MLFFFFSSATSCLCITLFFSSPTQTWFPPPFPPSSHLMRRLSSPRPDHRSAMTPPTDKSLSCLPSLFTPAKPPPFFSYLRAPVTFFPSTALSSLFFFFEFPFFIHTGLCVCIFSMISAPSFPFSQPGNLLPPIKINLFSWLFTGETFFLSNGPFHSTKSANFFPPLLPTRRLPFF